jgi:UDP-N-acetylglucosamine 2-epimerase (non-hydrolysing)
VNAEVMLVAGARPNFVKVAPVLRALDDRNVRTSLVHTGQHYDSRMSDVFFEELGIRSPDHSLEVGSGSHAQQTAAIMSRFDAVMESDRPLAVVVFGDVNSTVACSLTAAKRGSFVVHVEAGLRSRDWNMPEEINRVVTDCLSDLLLAPSFDARDNLLAEGVAPSRIRVVGNVMVDTLFANVGRAQQHRPLDLADHQYALATLHRPSNVDEPATLSRLVEVLGLIADRLPVVWPVHPRTRHALQGIAVPKSVVLCEPFGYLDFIALESRARLVLTDSGGVQEETTALGIPCLTLRDSTERPITLTEGTNRLVGTKITSIIDAVDEFLAQPPYPRRPELWDGHAGVRCVDAIVELLESSFWPRPTSHNTLETAP